MNGFRFGLEAEYCLADASSLRPVWYKDVAFKQLDEVFSSLSLEGIPSLDGLAAEPPHHKLMPWIVEGYGIPDADFKVIDAYPKGVEIRTPVCGSVRETLDVHALLYARLKEGLQRLNLVPLAISHHPTESVFSGPQNKRRHDYWQWAMEVMTTYGPDVNVSFPASITERLFGDVPDLEAKVDYYAPAMAALSLHSPLKDGRPWETQGSRGLSYRTFRRSIIAPPMELHADENHRVEFKVFEMTPRSRDFEAYFLLTLALFLDEGLTGRAGKHERIYELGDVARHGLRAQGVRGKLDEMLLRAPAALERHGFDPAGLAPLRERMETGRLPAHELLERLDMLGGELAPALAPLAQLHALDGRII